MCFRVSRMYGSCLHQRACNDLPTLQRGEPRGTRLSDRTAHGVSESESRRRWSMVLFKLSNTLRRFHLGVDDQDDHERFNTRNVVIEATVIDPVLSNTPV